MSKFDRRKSIFQTKKSTLLNISESKRELILPIKMEPSLPTDINVKNNEVQNSTNQLKITSVQSISSFEDDIVQPSTNKNADSTSLGLVISEVKSLNDQQTQKSELKIADVRTLMNPTIPTNKNTTSNQPSDVQVKRYNIVTIEEFQKLQGRINERASTSHQAEKQHATEQEQRETENPELLKAIENEARNEKKGSNRRKSQLTARRDDLIMEDLVIEPINESEPSEVDEPIQWPLSSSPSSPYSPSSQKHPSFTELISISFLRIAMNYILESFNRTPFEFNDDEPVTYASLMKHLLQ